MTRHRLETTRSRDNAAREVHQEEIVTTPRLAGAAVLALALAACSSTPEHDLIVRGGQVYDGTGAPGRTADVGVDGDRIVAVGDLSGRRGRREIDATGEVVAPGFIDTQGQSGTTLLIDGRGLSHVRQGITTEIIGEGGSPALWTPDTAEPESLQAAGVPYDWSGFGGYLERLQERGTSINVGSLTSINALRRDIVGTENRPATPEEMARMESMLETTMTEGSFGFSSALIYPPGSFSSTDELVALAKVAARHGGIYITHVRGESFRLKEAIDEAMAIGEQAKLPVVVYHLKVAARPNWGSMGAVLSQIEAARARGLQVSATQYPYTAGGTRLAACLPGWAQEGGQEAMLRRLIDPALRQRMRREIETEIDGWENLIAGSTFEGIQIASVPEDADHSVVGRRITEIAAARAKDPWEVFFDLLVETRGRAGALYHMMSEEDVRTAMASPWISIGTDAAAIAPEGLLGRGQPHPRAYGTFPRVLGKYVRDDKVLDLALGIHKMTGVAAAQMQIPDRGVIREQAFADLVVFDAATVTDLATFERPHQFPTGIDVVIVNGVVTVEGGAHTGATAGRALFGPGRRHH
jgi:N-acyl-D-aspartate/D-glutamate deacylase